MAGTGNLEKNWKLDWKWTGNSKFSTMVLMEFLEPSTYFLVYATPVRNF